MTSHTLTIDFETYWSRAERYTLSSANMTALDYITDPRFQIICVCAKFDNEAVRAWSGHQINEFDEWLSGIRLDETKIQAHNGIFFDFLILGWIFGVRPRIWEDSVLMARSLVPRGVHADLGSLARWLHLPPKGDEVHNTDGMRLEDFTPEGMSRYMDYCKRDVELSRMICDRLAQCWLPRDRIWMHLCCEMGANPRFELDKGIIENGISDEIERHKNINLTLAHELAARGVKLPKAAWTPRGPKRSAVFPTIEDAVKKAVGSISMCAELMEDLGEFVPMKFSEKQQKRVPALSKTDTDFTALADSDNGAVRALVEARLASKSSIRMSRLTRLLNTADKMDGVLPIFLEPFGASTGRNAGKQKMNIQNFASRKSASNPEGKANPMRRCMRAPEGHSVVDVDSSQIEVRVLGALTGEPNILKPFSENADIYCSFGTSLYGRPITKADKFERNVAKAAVLGNGYGQGGFGFQRYAKAYGIDFNLEEAQKVVDDYRRINSKVVEFWRACSYAVQCMLEGRSFSFGVNGCLRIEGQSLLLPSGRRIYYREIQERDQINPLTDEVVGKDTVYYDPRKRAWRRIHGPLMTENICQATAADVINTQAVYAFETWGYAPVAQVHDALVYIERNPLDGFLANMKTAMSITPDWLPYVPLKGDAEVGPSYGEMEEL